MAEYHNHQHPHNHPSSQFQHRTNHEFDLRDNSSGQDAQATPRKNTIIIDNQLPQGLKIHQKVLKQPSKFDLGSRWGSEEIDIFFDTYKRNGKDWQSILDELHLQGFTHRTIENIKSLYYKHKTYLNLATASAQDLTAIMTDYYKSLNLEKQRQLQQQQQMQQLQQQLQAKEDFICQEKIKHVKLPKRQNVRMTMPGYSSSSSFDNNDKDDEESKGGHYVENESDEENQQNEGAEEMQEDDEDDDEGRLYADTSFNQESHHQRKPSVGYQQHSQQFMSMQQQQQQQQYRQGQFKPQISKQQARFEQYGSRSAQNPYKHKSRQQYYHQFYHQGQRNERYPIQEGPSSHFYNHQSIDSYENEEQHQMMRGGPPGQMITPSRQKKKTLYPGGLPSRRLFSQNVSPAKGHHHLQGRAISISGLNVKQGSAYYYQGQFYNKQNQNNEASNHVPTKVKRQQKAAQNVLRRGFQGEMNPFAIVQDEAESVQMMKNQQPNKNFQRLSKLVNRWFRCEYFYSWIDRPYFLNHDFKQILAQLELINAKLTKSEWSFVRQSLAGERKKPRRFSESFIQEEKEKIKNYRDIFREIIKSMQHKNFVPDANGDLSMLLYDKKPQFNEDRVKEVLQIIKEYQIAPLVVGQRVLAIHPKTKELRTASLLTTDVQSYHAQFDRPELGVMIISDQHLVPISGSEYYQQHSNQSSNLQLNNLRNIYLYNKFCKLTSTLTLTCNSKYDQFRYIEAMIQRVRDGNSGQVVNSQTQQQQNVNPFSPSSMQIDEDDMNFIPFDHTQFSQDNIKAMAVLIILFERKNRLIQDLRQLNDQYQKNATYTEDFRQKYAWIAIQLQATNQIIEPVLTMFRFRQIKPQFLHLYEELDNANSQQVSQELLRQAQVIIDQAEEQNKVMKILDHNVPKFTEQVYNGLTRVAEAEENEEDAEMRDESSDANHLDQAAHLSTARSSIVITQASTQLSILKLLQSYYSVVKQPSSAAHNNFDNNASKEPQQLQFLRKIIDACDSVNGKRLQEYLQALRDMVLSALGRESQGDSNEIAYLMHSVSQEINALQETIQKKVREENEEAFNIKQENGQSNHDLNDEDHKSMDE